jgi:predicted nucleotidyltransferase
MKDLEKIRKVINEHSQELEQKYKVKSIAIFGSYVRGEQKKESDIDILVEFTEPVGLLCISSLGNYLSDLLRTSVDVVPKKNIRKELKDAILREAIPI